MLTAAAGVYTQGLPSMSFLQCRDLVCILVVYDNLNIKGNEVLNLRCLSNTVTVQSSDEKLSLLPRLEKMEFIHE